MKANVTAREVGASGVDFFSVSLMLLAFVSRVVVWIFSPNQGHQSTPVFGQPSAIQVPSRPEDSRRIWGLAIPSARRHPRYAG
jgi:hypothetical protein